MSKLGHFFKDRAELLTLVGIGIAIIAMHRSDTNRLCDRMDQMVSELHAESIKFHDDLRDFHGRLTKTEAVLGF